MVEFLAFKNKIGRARYLLQFPCASYVLPFVLKSLERRGYDALMLELETEVIGHTAFQIHRDNALHVFSTGIDLRYSGQNLGLFSWEKIIDFARNEGIISVRFGAGGHPFATRAYDSLCEKAEALKITPREDYWIDLHQ
ncbi:hypothetical protein COV18_00235 [Candidatus Woesearchaeota archaeon CG10_big_fil_rev_8_21_14_0_10_37_12]|nr:MAG: hypothetical protein COV18_00235 [Candidatus Woesearchaeota archaeon CG10_big_fil_rev_8_21_14_0_10_37_12]